MKHHRHCSQNALLSHVHTAVAPRFEVLDAEFKNAIMVLLEKEYIAVCSGQELQELMSAIPSSNKSLIVPRTAGEAVYKYLP